MKLRRYRLLRRRASRALELQPAADHWGPWMSAALPSRDWAGVLYAIDVVARTGAGGDQVPPTRALFLSKRLREQLGGRL